MNKTDNFVFWGLYLVAWLIFVGLSVEAGGLIVNFFFSLYDPQVVPLLYQKLDLTSLYHDGPMVFFGIYGFILSIAILKAVLFYTVIRLMHKMELTKPFSAFAASQIAQISHYALVIGLLSYLGRQLSKTAAHHGLATDVVTPFWDDAQAFILMGAVIYIIATIFKKGVAIQTENDLTV